jgi:hypothetical protein
MQVVGVGWGRLRLEEELRVSCPISSEELEVTPLNISEELEVTPPI